MAIVAARLRSYRRDHNSGVHKCPRTRAPISTTLELNGASRYRLYCEASVHALGSPIEVRFQPNSNEVTPKIRSVGKFGGVP